MTTIHKHVFDLLIKGPRFVLKMKKDAHILSLQMQNGVPTMWVHVRPENEDEDVSFRIYGTGHPIDEMPLEYIGTFQTTGGMFVWHLFKEVKFEDKNTDSVGNESAAA